ncbi:MAG: bifunctional proline dehydrogenase/L-glutamate gamma-semialdehyde dehydrogenase, partial [Pseudomonadota bacterium]
AGNLYVNRNQIGAVVGSQPFGGDGLSGTGPKAGGPLYLTRFFARDAASAAGSWSAACDMAALQKAIAAAAPDTELSRIEMPGPTGETNTLTVSPRAPLLCMGPGAEAARSQGALVAALGGIAVLCDGEVTPDQLAGLSGISGAIHWGADARDYAQALARRDGAILPLITGAPALADVVQEKHLCVDTTASGGNADLLAG